MAILSTPTRVFSTANSYIRISEYKLKGMIAKNIIVTNMVYGKGIVHDVAFGYIGLHLACCLPLSC